MGVTFRSSSYLKFVRIGGRTIKDGEAAVVWNNKGISKQVIGPERIYLFFATVRFLTRHKAEAQQYLVVKHRNGKVEHIRGPTELYENPAIHDDVHVEDGTWLSSSDFIIVRSEGKIDTTSIDENCIKGFHLPANLTKVRGPKLFIPSPSDHLHEFLWSKVDFESDVIKFTTLRDSPYPMNVRLKVPLSNGHHIQLELQIEYKISRDTSVEKLLQCDDPISRMHKAILADGQTFILTLEKVNEWKQAEMNVIFNNINSYSELTKTAQQNGIQIISVCLTSHTLSKELSALFDCERNLSRELNNKIKSKAQRQKLQSMEKDSKLKEIETNAELMRMQIESDNRLEKEMHELKIESLMRKSELDEIEANGSSKISNMKNESILLFLKEVKKLDVNMTEFLVSNNSVARSKQLPIPGADTDISFKC